MTADLERVVSLASQHHRALRAYHSEHLTSQLLPRAACFLTTTGHCDCGTALGSAHRESAHHSPPATAKQIAAFRRQGWSTTKIDRWLQQQTDVAARSERVSRDHDQQRTPDAEGWVSPIRAAIASGSTDSFGLLLHWYRGGVESERVTITDRHSRQASTLNVAYLLHIAEDTLYEFCP